MALLNLVKPFVPRRVRSAVKHIAGLDKYDWEFNWQAGVWLPLWKKPEVQAKGLEYWKRFRHLDEIKDLMQLTDASRILDVGCGLCSVLHYLPGQRVGIDPIARRYAEVYDYPFRVVNAPGERIPFEPNSFDAVFCSNCIDHTSKPQKVISEIFRVLSPGGYFALTCEVFDEDLGKRNAGHPHSITADALIGLASPFVLLEHWQSPWYGLYNYTQGNPPLDQTEHILLLRKRA